MYRLLACVLFTSFMARSPQIVASGNDCFDCDVRATAALDMSFFEMFGEAIKTKSTSELANEYLSLKNKFKQDATNFFQSISNHADKLARENNFTGNVNKEPFYKNADRKLTRDWAYIKGLLEILVKRYNDDGNLEKKKYYQKELVFWKVNWIFYDNERKRWQAIHLSEQIWRKHGKKLDDLYVQLLGANTKQEWLQALNAAPDFLEPTSIVDSAEVRPVALLAPLTSYYMGNTNNAGQALNINKMSPAQRASIEEFARVYATSGAEQGDFFSMAHRIVQDWESLSPKEQLNYYLLSKKFGSQFEQLILRKKEYEYSEQGKTLAPTYVPEFATTGVQLTAEEFKILQENNYLLDRNEYVNVKARP